MALSVSEIDAREKVAYSLLLPLIQENYKARELGVLPDEWYWADKLAIEWGMNDLPCYKLTNNPLH